MDATPFPNDLVQTQRDWTTTYQALAAPHPANNTALRQRLLRLSVRLWWDPRLHSRPAARTALRARIRTSSSTAGPG
ncbi:hypothetical protein ACFVSQ_09965 [Streptomyces niveus]|uniref:hypothetical protein n=1 Tax=Streptomyces niveus TaxID=193462 RepID=UPI0036EE1817